MGGQVCCLTKIAPFAECIDPSNFQSYGCETKPPPPASCTKPSDCTSGNVCCFEISAEKVSCQPAALCPSDGNNTFVICSTDADCPNQVSGACQPYPPAVDAGVPISFCM